MTVEVLPEIMDSTNICPTFLVCAFLDSVDEEVLHVVEVGFLSVLPFLEFTKRAVEVSSSSEDEASDNDSPSITARFSSSPCLSILASCIVSAFAKFTSAALSSARGNTVHDSLEAHFFSDAIERRPELKDFKVAIVRGDNGKLCMQSDRETMELDENAGESV